MQMKGRPLTPMSPYCHQWSELVDSKEIYRGKSYGWVYLCRPCNAYVGCHRGTTRPLGKLANAELRRARNEAHDAFDPIWQFGPLKRAEAYAWLAEQLGIARDATHIGEFDLEQCRRVIEVCSG